MDRLEAAKYIKDHCLGSEVYRDGTTWNDATVTAVEVLEGKDTNVPTNSALDHIHNVVRDDAYRRGYKQGKADANHPEIPDSWIPVTEKMPEEKDTMFAKYWGTDRWNKYMFRKRSDMVEVTVELDDGTRVTKASRTRDGKWAIEEEYGFVHKKVVAWHPMSEPWKGE